jgi:hypothetical protein
MRDILRISLAIYAISSIILISLASASVDPWPNCGCGGGSKGEWPTESCGCTANDLKVLRAFVAGDSGGQPVPIETCVQGQSIPLYIWAQVQLSRTVYDVNVLTYAYIVPKGTTTKNIIINAYNPNGPYYKGICILPADIHGDSKNEAYIKLYDQPINYICGDTIFFENFRISWEINDQQRDNCVISDCSNRVTHCWGNEVGYTIVVQTPPECSINGPGSLCSPDTAPRTYTSTGAKETGYTYSYVWMIYPTGEIPPTDHHLGSPGTTDPSTYIIQLTSGVTPVPWTLSLIVTKHFTTDSLSSSCTFPINIHPRPVISTTLVTS